MYIVCLDMEGVLVPEVWITFAKEQGIPELERTTRDEPSYRALTDYRLRIMKEHGLTIKDVQKTAAKMNPFPGARSFLDDLRARTEVIIVSDIFSLLAPPLIKKLGRPTLFCNELRVSAKGSIERLTIRCNGSKLASIQALQQAGFDTIAAGDSLNDLGMIQGSKAGFFFNASDAIKQAHPDIAAFDTYPALFAAISAAMED